MNELFKIKLAALIFIVMFSHKNAFCQETNQNETAVTLVKNKDSNSLLKYLFGKYGIEKTETIVKNISNYEAVNNVKVLTKEDYILLVPQIDAKIESCNDPAEKQYLMDKKFRLVLISHIESLVN